MNVYALRKEYLQRTLSRKDLAHSPYDQFTAWFEEAVKAEVIEPNGMALATATPEGVPSCRLVLMKTFDKTGITFFTNIYSRKGQELTLIPQAAATFWWKELERQVHIEGRVERAPDAVVKKYFSSRPRKSQLMTRSSRQGEPIPSRRFLEKETNRLETLYQDMDVPLPQDWGGFKIIPSRFEFWQGRESRAHDRFHYTFNENAWKVERLSP